MLKTAALVSAVTYDKISTSQVAPVSKPSQVLALVTNQHPLEMLHGQWPCSYGFVSGMGLCPKNQFCAYQATLQVRF